MTTQNQKPITLRDGKIKATIWKNTTEKGHFYTVELSRTYQDDQENYHDSHSYSGSEPLQVSRLALKAYDHIAELRRQDAQDASDTGGSS